MAESHGHILYEWGFAISSQGASHEARSRCPCGCSCYVLTVRCYRRSARSTATDERLVNQFANDDAAAVRADDGDWLSEMRGRLEDAEAAAQQATFLLRRLIQVIDSDDARDEAMREWVQDEVIAPQLRAVK